MKHEQGFHKREHLKKCEITSELLIALQVLSQEWQTNGQTLVPMQSVAGEVVAVEQKLASALAHLKEAEKKF